MHQKQKHRYFTTHTTLMLDNDTVKYVDESKKSVWIPRDLIGTDCLRILVSVRSPNSSVWCCEPSKNSFAPSSVQISSTFSLWIWRSTAWFSLFCFMVEQWYINSLLVSLKEWSDSIWSRHNKNHHHKNNDLPYELLYRFPYFNNAFNWIRSSRKLETLLLLLRRIGRIFNFFHQIQFLITPTPPTSNVLKSCKCLFFPDYCQHPQFIWEEVKEKLICF